MSLLKLFNRKTAEYFLELHTYKMAISRECVIDQCALNGSNRQMFNKLWFSILKLSNDCHHNFLTLSVCGSESGTLLWGSPIAEIVLLCQNWVFHCYENIFES